MRDVYGSRKIPIAPYVGVRTDAHILYVAGQTNGVSHGHGFDNPSICRGFGPIPLFDLPFSFVLDTILFPFDAIDYWWLHKPQLPPQKEDEDKKDRQPAAGGDGKPAPQQ